MVLGIDLNVPLPDNSHANEVGTSFGAPAEPGVRVGQHRPRPAPLVIDVESFDDDVVLSSSGAFLEAKNKSRRRWCRNWIRSNADDELGTANRGAVNIPNKRLRIPVNQPVIDVESYPIVERDGNTVNGYGKDMTTQKKMYVAPPPPPPPPVPTFSCPVCMGPLVEETSTKCGHIFCKACIRKAISVQKKCPTCRRKMAVKDTIRVYLPKAS